MTNTFNYLHHPLVQDALYSYLTPPPNHNHLLGSYLSVLLLYTFSKHTNIQVSHNHQPSGRSHRQTFNLISHATSYVFMLCHIKLCCYEPCFFLYISICFSSLSEYNSNKVSIYSHLYYSLFCLLSPIFSKLKSCLPYEK